MTDKAKLGFKKDIRLEWMNHSLYLTLQGLPEKEIRKELDEYLSLQRTEQGESFTVGSKGLIKPLLTIWFKQNPICIEFRNALIEEAKKTNSSNWRPFHWALISTEYPLCYHVADQFGRLFSLQEIVKPSQIYSRVTNIYGDTKTVARNTRYIIATMAYWGLINKPEGKTGQYLSPALTQISPMTYALICEAILLAKGSVVDYETLIHDKNIYPFSHEALSPEELTTLSNGRIYIVQHSLGRYVLSHTQI